MKMFRRESRKAPNNSQGVAPRGQNRRGSRFFAKNKEFSVEENSNDVTQEEMQSPKRRVSRFFGGGGKKTPPTSKSNSTSSSLPPRPSTSKAPPAESPKVEDDEDMGAAAAKVKKELTTLDDSENPSESEPAPTPAVENDTLLGSASDQPAKKESKKAKDDLAPPASSSNVTKKVKEDPAVVKAYDDIPVMEQVKLPRGGVSVETKAVGRVQVRAWGPLTRSRIDDVQ
jgi:hypothetical protein